MGTLPPVHKPPARSDATPWVRTVDHNANRAFYPQMMRLAKELGIDPKRCVCVCVCVCANHLPAPPHFLTHNSSVLMANRDRDYLWIAEAARDAVYEEPIPAPWKRLKPKHA